MQVSVLAVGKLKERFWQDACNEYLKRMRPFAQVNVLEVADVSAERLTSALAQQKEAERISKLLKPDMHLIALDSHGRQFTSEDWAFHLQDLMNRGVGHLAFLIGGSTGLDPNLLERSNEQLSFGKMTLPHNLARVVLIEQIYRAFTIMKGHPYHK